MKSIMIIEDNEDVRSTLADILSTLGHNVHQAVDGKDALEVLGGIPIPSLIILDIMMPVMDGPTFYGEFRKHQNFANVPVVIFSAIEDRVKFEGAVGHLKKPASLEDLLGFVNKYCE